MLIEEYYDVELYSFIDKFQKAYGIEDIKVILKELRLFHIFNMEHVIFFFFANKAKKRFEKIIEDTDNIYFPDYKWMHQEEYFENMINFFNLDLLNKSKENYIQYPIRIDAFLKNFDFDVIANIEDKFKNEEFPYDPIMKIVIMKILFNMELERNDEKSYIQYNYDAIFKLYQTEGKVLPIPFTGMNYKDFVKIEKYNNNGELVQYDENTFNEYFKKYNEALIPFVKDDAKDDDKECVPDSLKILRRLAEEKDYFLRDYAKIKVNSQIFNLIEQILNKSTEIEKNNPIKIEDYTKIYSMLINTAMMMKVLSKNFDNNLKFTIELLVDIFIRNMYLVIYDRLGNKEGLVDLKDEYLKRYFDVEMGENNKDIYKLSFPDKIESADILCKTYMDSLIRYGFNEAYHYRDIYRLNPEDIKYEKENNSFIFCVHEMDENLYNPKLLDIFLDIAAYINEEDKKHKKTKNGEPAKKIYDLLEDTLYVKISNFRSYNSQVKLLNKIVKECIVAHYNVSENNSNNICMKENEMIVNLFIRIRELKSQSGIISQYDRKISNLFQKTINPLTL